MKTYIVKEGDKYCRFGSYGTFDLVDNPLQANTYTRIQDARARLKPHGIFRPDDFTGVFRIVEFTIKDFEEVDVK